MESIIFSCVLDNNSLLKAQTFIWVNSLIYIKGISPDAIYVHTVNIDDFKFMQWLRAERVNIVQCEPFDQGNPYCNKLAQLDTFSRFYTEKVVLMDCDTAYIGSLSVPNGETVTAKIVDFGNPPEEIIAGIFREAGLGEPNWVDVSFLQGEGRHRTDYNNCNGGVYIIKGSFIPLLRSVWHRWAKWCIDHIVLFGGYRIHVDQVSFALALREIGISRNPLSIEWNYPTPIPVAMLPNIEPQILHYHQHVTPKMRLKRIGLTKPDEAIRSLNKFIDKFPRTTYDG